MPLRTLQLAVVLISGSLMFAQEAQPPAGSKVAEKPQVRVNYLNVCTPPSSDQQTIENVLSRITPKPTFAVDMEISRGRSTLNPSDLVVNTGQPTQQTNAVSRWVRIRRDFPETSHLSSSQYSFSVTEKHVSETLVIHFKDAKDVLQVSISDALDSDNPIQVADQVTLADRIRIERFGKASIVLARCPNANQDALEPLFGHATMLLNAYRRALNTEEVIPSEFKRLSAQTSGATKKSNKASTKAH